MNCAFDVSIEQAAMVVTSRVVQPARSFSLPGACSEVKKYCAVIG